MGDASTIQISSNLVNKILKDAEGPTKRTKRSKQRTPEVPSKHKSEVNSTPAVAKSGSGSGWPGQSPLFVAVPVPSTPAPTAPALAELEAIRSVLQESESVLKKLRQQEANITQELTHRAKDFRDKEFKLPYQKSTPCEAEREACHQCYQENSKQPLKCAQVVRLFEHCTRLARLQQQQQQVNSEL